MQKEKTGQNQKGITLIALISTIIVMLILVGVSVTVALKGGLFNTAQNAKEGTKAERDKELALDEGKVEVNVKGYNSIDEYVNGSSEEQKVTISPKKETYTVGEEVTIGDEHFFVIADDTEKVSLLAKYNLNQEGTAQLNATYSETACVFSTAGGFTSEEDLNNNSTVRSDSISAVYKAIQYGNKFEKSGVTGRLMREDEAKTLKTNYSGIIFGTNINAINGFLYYWLGTAGGSDSVRVVDGTDNSLTGDDFDYTGWYGVRPVIEISKSAI